MWSSSRWPWATGLVLLLGLRTSWVLPGAPDNAWGARQASLCSGKGSPGSSQVSQAPRRRHAVHSAQGQSRRGRGDHRGGPRDASGARLSAAPPPNWRRVSPGPATLTCEEAQGTHSPREGPGWTHGHIRWASPGRTPRCLSPDVAREPTLTSGDLVVEGDVGVLLHTLTHPEPRGPRGRPVA